MPAPPQQGTGRLEGRRLTFGGEELGWEGALATVVEDRAERVFVVLCDVSENDEKPLDLWDGMPSAITASSPCRCRPSKATPRPGCTC